MKEITRVCTVQITEIDKVSEDDAALLVKLGDKITQVAMSRLKAITGYDDVLLLDRKDFIVDLEEKE